MKDYKKLTIQSVDNFKYCLKDHKAKIGEFNDYDAFFDYSMAVKRLGELEDKIERGEIDYVAEKDKEIARLTAENDKLTARLENAVELPTMSEFKIVDLHTNFYQIAYAVLYKSNGKLYIYQCFDKAKAEAKLKEIRGNE